MTTDLTLSTALAERTAADLTDRAGLTDDQREALAALLCLSWDDAEQVSEIAQTVLTDLRDARPLSNPLGVAR